MTVKPHTPNTAGEEQSDLTEANSLGLEASERTAVYSPFTKLPWELQLEIAECVWSSMGPDEIQMDIPDLMKVSRDFKELFQPYENSYMEVTHQSQLLEAIDESLMLYGTKDLPLSKVHTLHLKTWLEEKTLDTLQEVLDSSNGKRQAFKFQTVIIGRAWLTSLLRPDQAPSRPEIPDVYQSLKGGDRLTHFTTKIVRLFAPQQVNIILTFRDEEGYLFDMSNMSLPVEAVTHFCKGWETSKFTFFGAKFADIARGIAPFKDTPRAITVVIGDWCTSGEWAAAEHFREGFLSEIEATKQKVVSDDGSITHTIDRVFLTSDPEILYLMREKLNQHWLDSIMLQSQQAITLKASLRCAWQELKGDDGQHTCLPWTIRMLDDFGKYTWQKEGTLPKGTKWQELDMVVSNFGMDKVEVDTVA